MIRKKRVLLISCSVILLCMAMIVGVTYSLFTDTVKVKNHLRAGDLELSLVRRELEYSVLDEDGYLRAVRVEDDVDFSSVTDANVFGIDAEDVRIVPGSYFDATMEISNGGNVAFGYSVGIRLSGVSNALAEQLRVRVTHPDGSVSEKMLSEMAGGIAIDTGSMACGDNAQSFGVRVEFVDDLDYNRELDDEELMIDNDEAKAQSAVFDLIVTATQATT